MAQRVDMGADMQRQQDGVLGKLEVAGTPRAGRVVATVAVHEMHHARPMRRHRRAWRQWLRQAYHLPGAHQRGGGTHLRRADMVQRALLIVLAPKAPGLLGHTLLGHGFIGHGFSPMASTFNSRRISLPVAVIGSSLRNSMMSGTL